MFVKQAGGLWHIKQLIRQSLAELIETFHDPHHHMEGISMAVCVLRGARQLKSFRGMMVTSYRVAKKIEHHGFRGHLLVTFVGLIVVPV